MPGKKLLLIIIAAVAVSAAGGFLYLRNRDLPPDPNFDFPTDNIELTMVMPEGGEAEVNRIIDLYNKKHKNVSIKLSTFPRDTYHQVLKESLNFGRPPDIYAYKNSYTQVLKDGLGSVSGEVFQGDDIREYSKPVVDQLTEDKQLLGIPLSSGSLVLYTNRKMLNEAKVGVPENWPQVLEAALKLNVKAGGQVSIGAVAMGTANNVDQAGNILASLMLQNGALIVAADRKHAVFNEPETSSFFPGTEALKFYVSFANPGKDYYSWHTGFPRSRTSFSEERVAMILGGPDMVFDIKKAKPDLDFETSRMPQVKDGTPVTIADFWAIGVPKDAKYSLVAWDFIKFLTNKKNAGAYAEAAWLPAARNDILAGQGSVRELKGLINSADIAQNIYKKDPDLFELIFRRMILRVFTGENPQKVIDSEAANLTESLKD